MSNKLAHLKMLVPVAAMLLALPAGESHDEFVFSAAGRIFSDDRNAMSPTRLEQVTIIVMFLRNEGWSHEKLNKWVQAALEENKKHKGAGATNTTPASAPSTPAGAAASPAVAASLRAAATPQ